MPFHVLGLWLHLKEIFFGLGLTVTSKNTETRNTSKSCRDGMHATKYANKIEMM